MIFKEKTGLAAVLAITLVAGCATAAQSGDKGMMMANSDSCGTKVEGKKRVIEALEKAGTQVYFDLDQSDLKTEGMSAAEAQAKVLSKNKRSRIRIEGNADERGTREYNLALGERRAASLKSQLVSMGADGANIETITYGEECPAVAESNEAAWAKNRRDVVVSTN